MLKRVGLALALLFLFGLRVHAAPSSSLMISEVKVAGDEWVELANTGSTPAGANWKIQYRAVAGGSWSTKVTISDDIDPAEIVYFPASSLADSGGHVQLVDDSNLSVDVVSWGATLAGVTETKHLPAPNDTQTLKRFWDESINNFVDSDDNTSDFFVSYLPSPGSSDLHSNQNYPTIEISEILPDPDSASIYDDEFIELYNPNNVTVNLSGYTLHVGGDVFVINGIGLLPNQYIALPKSYDPADLNKLYTNLNLTGDEGVVSLQSPNGKTETKLTYAGGKKSLSYGSFAEGLAWTEQPTPGAKNQLVVTGKSNDSTGNGLQPCREDQFRNPETNRCKLKTSASSSLKPCASNQYRNPETNRCKAIETAGSSLQPCASDQYRNPETNRCKKIESASTSLKACAPNQERNPETNRCRLRTNATPTSARTEAVESASDSSKSLPLVGIIGGGALMYGLYEWRYDIRNFFHRAGSYLGFRRGSGRDP